MLFNVRILIQRQNVDRRCTNIGPMRNITLGHVVLQPWADKLLTLSQRWANQWCYLGVYIFKCQLSISYSLIFTFSKCHRNRMFLYFFGTSRLSIYLLFRVLTPNP